MHHRTVAFINFRSDQFLRAYEHFGPHFNVSADKYLCSHGSIGTYRQFRPNVKDTQVGE